MFLKKFIFRKKGNDEARPSNPPRDDSSHLIPHGPSFLNHGDLKSLSQSSARGISPSRKVSECDPGPLGLNAVYTPENGHKADMVFVHGLGGSSQMTWSKYNNPELFWPLKFLPLDPDICSARILSFGYNANFRKSCTISTVVLDLAKDLLYDLKFAKDEKGGDLNMGDAYIQGQNDPKYERIVKAISAITFFSTPHRGTNLAESMNRILQSTGVSNSKQYISKLAKNSFTLKNLNEQFRHIAPKLDIVSFYETQPTSIGLKNAKVMVLEKDSSVLGYPGETSKALNADHHGVCKFENIQDPNFITVRNILKSLMSKIIATSFELRSSNLLVSTQGQSRDLKALLAIPELPDVDYISFRDQWTPGTNEWILQEQPYLQMLNFQGPANYILSMKGGAASGKSVLASFIINSLLEQGHYCQYHFIRFGNREKRTLSLLLRSIAYQIAEQVPTFLQKMSEYAGETMDFETADPKTIWQRIFKSILFKMEDEKPLYWIIDGLDEADDARAIIKLFSDITMSSVPIRIVLLGRETPEIKAGLKKIPKEISHGTLDIGGKVEDLRCSIFQELTTAGSPEFRESTIEKIVEGSQSNFLWVRLVVEKINSCHTRTDVDRALRELPLGMNAIYDRMALSIVESPSSSDQELATSILERVTCSSRLLTVSELSWALVEDISEMLDFQQSVVSLCGGFVVIDNSGNLAMIHQTAREYLFSKCQRRFHIDQGLAHEQLFLSCMRCLMSNGLRAKISRDLRPEFLDYSANWWHSHLVSVPVHSDQAFTTLYNFLAGHWIQTWIQVLATDKQLRILIQASKHLSKYVCKRKAYIAKRDGDHQIVEQQFIESWAVDFVKLVGKFGSNLHRNPESIYRSIPPFCPHNSAIYQQFGKGQSRNLMVSGFSSQNWDDSLGRLSFGFGTYASSISSVEALIAILVPSGSIFLYDSSVFEEARSSPIKHGERVYRMQLSTSGTLLVTYGFKTTKLWDLSTGKCKCTVQNLESRPRPLAMILTNNNCTLLVGMDDRRIRSLNFNDASPTWQLVAELDEPEIQEHFLNSSSYMALNNDGSLIAIAYRGHPLSAWEIDGRVHINHCWRARKEMARGEVIEAVWHPHSPELLGLYIEGVVFKWNPYGGEPEELSVGASRLAISSDGNLFATGDVRGGVMVYTTSKFHLLYQLSSQDAVFGMAFSPDLRRFYDIRGYYGNAWEPNALMRYAEQTGKHAENDRELESIVPSFMASISASQRIESVTVLAVSPTGKLYCSGTDYGTARLFDTQKGKLSDLHISKGSLSIERIAWSDDGRYICLSDSGKRIFIVSLTFEKIGSDLVANAKVEVPLKSNTKGPILQLLFHPYSSHILIYTSTTICTILLESASVTNTLAWDSDKDKWIAHPQDPTLILAFGGNAVKIMNWNLDEKCTIPFEHTQQKYTQTNDENKSISSSVDRVLVTPDKKNILAQVSLNMSTREKLFLYFSTSSISNAQQRADPATITPVILAPHVTSQISQTLSFLKHDRLVFLSKTYSVCVWSFSRESDVRDAQPPIKRHYSHNADALGKARIKEIFALPGDWISIENLALCSVWVKERSFLCPRNGEVAVVRSSGLI